MLATQWIGLTLLGPVAWAGGAQAQSVSGVVVDSAGVGIAEVELQLAGAKRVTLSGADGSFRFDRAKEKRLWLVARRSGFRPALASGVLVKGRPTEIRLTLLPDRADHAMGAAPGAAVARLVRAKVRERRLRADGRFVDSEQWQTMRAASVGELAREASRPMVTFEDEVPRDGAPGIVPDQATRYQPPPPPREPGEPNRPDMPGAASYFYSSSSFIPPGPFAFRPPIRRLVPPVGRGPFWECSPAVSVNDGEIRLDQDAEDYALGTVRAVEFFSGLHPDELRRAGTDRELAARLACGVVVVWGKR